MKEKVPEDDLASRPAELSLNGFIPILLSSEAFLSLCPVPQCCCPFVSILPGMDHLASSQ